ncbi:hypothetical protein TeGR_g12279, partial [Tetraparma gracilis]
PLPQVMSRSPPGAIIFVAAREFVAGIIHVCYQSHVPPIDAFTIGTLFEKIHANNEDVREMFEASCASDQSDPFCRFHSLTAEAFHAAVSALTSAPSFNLSIHLSLPSPSPDLPLLACPVYSVLSHSSPSTAPVFLSPACVALALHSLTHPGVEPDVRDALARSLSLSLSRHPDFAREVFTVKGVVAVAHRVLQLCASADARESLQRIVTVALGTDHYDAIEQVVRGVETWWGGSRDGGGEITARMCGELPRIVSAHREAGREAQAQKYVEVASKAVMAVVKSVGSSGDGGSDQITSMTVSMRCLTKFCLALGVLSKAPQGLGAACSKLLERFCADLEADERFVAAVRAAAVLPVVSAIRGSGYVKGAVKADASQ